MDEAKGQGAHPAWIDREAYPFRPQWMSFPWGRLHYVDEGQGKPVVMVHGNPTWSYLFRHLIRHLRPAFRCIAFDLPGFGLSSRLPGTSGPEAMARVLKEALDRLALEEGTLVVHDWGGPIGLSYALNCSVFSQVVVFNSFFWPGAERRRLRLFSRLVGGWPGRWAAERHHLLVRLLMRAALQGPARLDGRRIRPYLRPLRAPEDRAVTVRMAASLVSASPWLNRLWAGRNDLQRMRALIVWGMRDPMFGEESLDRWVGCFWNPQVVRLAHAGHFVPEDAGPMLGPLVEDFLTHCAFG